MAYDPQRNRPRRRPDNDEPSPVDSLLDGAGEQSASEHGDPAPGPSVTLGPADRWSDRLLYSTGMSTVLGTALGLLVLRLLWRRWRHQRRTRD